jgi:hypothetical protein
LWLLLVDELVVPMSSVAFMPKKLDMKDNGNWEAPISFEDL